MKQINNFCGVMLIQYLYHVWACVLKTIETQKCSAWEHTLEFRHVCHAHGFVQSLWHNSQFWMFSILENREFMNIHEQC